MEQSKVRERATSERPGARAWEIDADTVTHQLARDFAIEAYGRSKEINARFEEIDVLVQRLAALPGGEGPALELDGLVGTLAVVVSDLAASIGVDVAREFKPGDLWHKVATAHAERSNDLGEMLRSDEMGEPMRSEDFGETRGA